MQITITDKGDLKAFARAIRKEAGGPALRKEMAAALRAELKPAVAAVKQSYAGGQHLRPALRRATRQEVRLTGRQAGVRVRVDGRRMFPRGGSLPAMWEGLKPFRHPVFGNRDVWVPQRSPGRFFEVVRPFEARVRARIDEIATDVARRIESR